MRRHLLVRVGSTKGPARPFPVVDRVRFVSVSSAWAKRSFTTHVPIPDRSIPFPHRHARRVSNFIQSGASLKSWWTASRVPTATQDRRDGCRHVSQEPTAAQRGRGDRPAKRSVDRGGCNVRPAAAGSTAAILAKFLSTKAPCVVASSAENRKFTFPENALIATTAAP